MEKLSFGGTVVPSCMLGAGIRGTYGSKLRNFINPLGPRVTNINFSPNSIRSSRVTIMYENYQIAHRREHALILSQILLTILKKKNVWR